MSLHGRRQLPTWFHALVAALGALCFGCGKDAAAPEEGARCPPGSALTGTECRVFAVRTVERMPTPWVEGGRSLTLEMVVYKPPSSIAAATRA